MWLLLLLAVSSECRPDALPALLLLLMLPADVPPLLLVDFKLPVLPLEVGSLSKVSVGGGTIAKRAADSAASLVGSQPWDANIVRGEADTQRKQGLRSALTLQGSFTMRPRAASTFAMSYRRRTCDRWRATRRE